MHFYNHCWHSNILILLVLCIWWPIRSAWKDKISYILIHEMEFLSKFHIMYCCTILFLSPLILFFNPPNKLTYSFKFLFINTKIKRLSHKNGRCNNGNPDLLNDFTPGVQKGRNIWFIHSFLTIHHPFSYHVVFHMWGVTIKVLPSSWLDQLHLYL